MSCTLFSRVSFLALAGDSVFQALGAEAGVNMQGLAETLFSETITAYRQCNRDGSDNTVNDRVREAEKAVTIDAEFIEYLTGERNLTSLCQLIELIITNIRSAS